ncbi:MAG: hypothetical protein DRH20_00895 [Deltaproteobacteria bacterium]|nr:MAG: hypothetical protein DRH20_00895 [Deltaproteobacteria bacterium]
MVPEQDLVETRRVVIEGEDSGGLMDDPAHFGPPGGSPSLPVVPYKYLSGALSLIAGHVPFVKSFKPFGHQDGYLRRAFA